MKLKSLRLATALLIASCAWLAQPAAAQVGSSTGGIAEAKVIGDHVLVRVVLSTERFHKETHMVLDYTDEQPLRIYNCILGSVEYGEGEETIKILADGLRIEVPKEGVEASSECTLFLKNLSGQYSVELKDVDVSAILGGPVLRQFALGMNLGEGEVSFTPAAEARVEDAMLWAQSIITGLRTTEDGRVLAPLSVGEKDRSLMAFNTAGYHSYINAALAGGLGYPFGDVPDIYFGAGDQRVPLSGMAALFPADFYQDPELSSDWLIVPGLSLWTAFRLEINPPAGLPGAGAGGEHQLLGSRFRVLLRGRQQGPRGPCGRTTRATPTTATWPRRPNCCSRWGLSRALPSRSRWRRWITASPPRWSA